MNPKQTTTCWNCHGEGEVRSWMIFKKECPVCHGSGVVAVPALKHETPGLRFNKPNLTTPYHVQRTPKRQTPGFGVNIAKPLAPTRVRPPYNPFTDPNNPANPNSHLNPNNPRNPMSHRHPFHPLNPNNPNSLLNLNNPMNPMSHRHPFHPLNPNNPNRFNKPK